VLKDRHRCAQVLTRVADAETRRLQSLARDEIMAMEVPPPPGLPPESGVSAPAPYGANNPRGACRWSWRGG